MMCLLSGDILGVNRAKHVFGWTRLFQSYVQENRLIKRPCRYKSAGNSSNPEETAGRRTLHHETINDRYCAGTTTAS